MADANYSDTTTAENISPWIFKGFDPGIEYRTKPGDEDTVQRRKKVSYARSRILAGSVQFVSAEGKIAEAGDLDSNNGNFGGAPGTGRPTGSARFICSDNRLDNAGGQGSGIYNETQTWEAYTNWEDWPDIESELGVTNPLT